MLGRDLAWRKSSGRQNESSPCWRAAYGPAPGQADRQIDGGSVGVGSIVPCVQVGHSIGHDSKQESRS